MDRYGFFSQKRFDKNKQLLNKYVIDVIKTNKQYPYVGTLLYGNFYINEANVVVFVTHLAFKSNFVDPKYDDLLCVGRIIGFSHYPEEILSKSDYDDPITKICLYGKDFITSIR